MRKKQKVVAVRLPVKPLSILNIQNKNDNLCGMWCIIVGLHSVKTVASGTKSNEKLAFTRITAIIYLQNGLSMKYMPKSKDLHMLTKTVLIYTKNEPTTCVFSFTIYKKVPKNDHEEKRIVF